MKIALRTSVPSAPLVPSVPLTSDWHAALMDYGSLVCSNNASQRKLCSLHKDCRDAFKKKGRRKAGRKEEGRMECRKFVPNRIFRGRIIEQLRKGHRGMTVIELGKIVKKDWHMTDRKWLTEVLKRLEQDRLLTRKSKRYSLPT